MIETLVIDPQVKVRDPSQLLTMPRVIRVQSFNEEAVKQLSRDVSLAHQSGQPILPLVIDSYGGDPYGLWAMVDILDTAKMPVATIIEGKGLSCGAVLFACGSEGYRFIGPNATLMIHDVTSSDDSDKRSEDMRVDASETDRLNKKMYRFIEKRIGQPKGYFSALYEQRARTDWWITPREAVKLRLANHIRIPTLKTSVSVKVELL